MCLEATWPLSPPLQALDGFWYPTRPKCMFNLPNFSICNIPNGSETSLRPPSQYYRWPCIYQPQYSLEISCFMWIRKGEFWYETRWQDEQRSRGDLDDRAELKIHLLLVPKRYSWWVVVMQVKTLARTARKREWRIAGASVTQLTRNEHLAPKRKPAIYLTQFNARR